MPSGNEWIWIGGCIGFIALLELISHTPMYPRFVWLLGGPDPNFPKPPLNQGETVLREGQVEFRRGQFGGRVGRLMLTNQRVIWYEDSSWNIAWPFRRMYGEVRLEDVVSVAPTGALERVFGGRRLQIESRGGRKKRLWVDGLDDWTSSIHIAAASAR